MAAAALVVAYVRHSLTYLYCSLLAMNTETANLSKLAEIIFMSCVALTQKYLLCPSAASRVPPSAIYHLWRVRTNLHHRWVQAKAHLNQFTARI